MKSMPYFSISCRKPRAQTLFAAMRDFRSRPTYSGIAALLGQIRKTSLRRHLPFDQFDAAAADALVEDLGGAAAQNAAGIGRMGHCAGPGDERAFVEDRLDDHLVVDVGRSDVRVVEIELVAFIDAGVLGIDSRYGLDRVLAAGREAQMSRGRVDGGAIGRVEGAHAFAALDDDRRSADLLQARCALLRRCSPDDARTSRSGRDRSYGLLHARVVLLSDAFQNLAPASGTAERCCGIRRSRPRCSGTTMVVNGVSMIAGPRSGCRAERS